MSVSGIVAEEVAAIAALTGEVETFLAHLPRGEQLEALAEVERLAQYFIEHDLASAVPLDERARRGLRDENQRLLLVCGELRAALLSPIAGSNTPAVTQEEDRDVG